MTKRKKIIVLSCMIALLITTAVLNFVLSSSVIGSPSATDAVTTANYFTEIKTTKNTSRAKQIEQLNEIISAGNENPEVYNDALKMKVKLTSINEKENLLESLIKAKGYEEVAVTLGVSSDNVSVIVRDNAFDQDDAILIYTVCQNELSVSPENVYIQSIS